MSSPLLASIDGVHDGFPHRQKDLEKARLFREICRGGSPTRTGLASRLALRPTSVSQAVQELIGDGLVAERRHAARGKSGRPLEILVTLPDRVSAISLYVESRDLKGVLVNLDGTSLAEEKRALPAAAENRDVSAALLDIARSLGRKAPAGSLLAGAGVSLVGTVNARTRTWVKIARWPRLRDLDLSRAPSRLGFPVLLQRTNEVELSSWLACHPDKASGSVLLLHWGFGIGAAVSYRGTMLESSVGMFGEIGHARLASDRNALCTCGSRGCLEAEAALWALLPALRARFGALPEDEKALAPLLGNPRALRVPAVRRALSAVHEALLVLQRLFDPDTILLSGPFVENSAVAGRLIEGLQRSLPAHARGSVGLEVIPAGMSGCRRDGASPLLRECLRELLRRKK